jgi:hypothetical protein
VVGGVGVSLANCAEQFGRMGVVYAIDKTTGDVTPLSLDEYNLLVDSDMLGGYQVRLDQQSAEGLSAAIRDKNERTT